MAVEIFLSIDGITGESQKTGAVRLDRNLQLQQWREQPLERCVRYWFGRRQGGPEQPQPSKTVGHVFTLPV